MYRIAQGTLVEAHRQQLLDEADAARLAGRIHRPEPRVERRVRNAISLRLQLAR